MTAVLVRLMFAYDMPCLQVLCSAWLNYGAVQVPHFTQTHDTTFHTVRDTTH